MDNRRERTANRLVYYRRFEQSSVVVGLLTKSRSNERTWVDDIVAAILAHGGEADLTEIYDHIRIYTSRGSGRSWLQSTRQRIYENSSDTIQFRGEDIFYSVKGLGGGRWGIRRKWLIGKQIIQAENGDLDEQAAPSREKPAHKTEGRTWYDEIFDAIKAKDGVAKLSEIYDWIENNASQRLTVAWKTSVRRSLYDYSSDSDGYKGVQDLFYAVGGIGNGVWAIRTEQLEDESPSHLVGNKPVKSQTTTLAVRTLSQEEDCTERIGRTTYQLKRNAKLATALKQHYGYRCQVCRRRTRISGGYYAEVHHVKPRNSHSGKDVWENMLVLCPQHHVEFDYSVICIDPNGMRYLHRFDKAINGQPVYQRHPHHLDSEDLRYAKEHLFFKSKSRSR